MNNLIPILFHSSQLPENIRVDLFQSFRHRQINSKFHYQSYRQALLWIAVHEAYSPAQNDQTCMDQYEMAIRETSLGWDACQVISLGCGDGQKDVQLLAQLLANQARITYHPWDASPSLVVTAAQTASKLLPRNNILPAAMDIAKTEDIEDFSSLGLLEGSPKLALFFGMTPNFEPDVWQQLLKSLLVSGDKILISANLAPGMDYAAGMEKILPGYNNAATKEWLSAFLSDYGISASDGEIKFRVENKGNLNRVVAEFIFAKKVSLPIYDQKFDFVPGDNLGLFFSYRYTPDLFEKYLHGAGLQLIKRWGTPEEGLFLCQR